MLISGRARSKILKEVASLARLLQEQILLEEFFVSGEPTIKSCDSFDSLAVLLQQLFCGDSSADTAP